MKQRIETAIELGKMLRERLTDDIIRRAEEENPWFCESEILSAVEAIRTQMLCEEALRGWVAAYPALAYHQAQRTLIIMAGNIPLVGFADLLAALIVGDEIFVKPSHKDKVLCEWLLRLLDEIEPRLPIYIYNGCQPVDRVLAMGSDEAIKHFETQFRGVPSLLRGTRYSLAVLTDAKQLALISKDIYSYSGMGCRNVSMIWLPKKFSLDEIKAHFPSLETHPKYRNNYLQNKALRAMQKAEFIDIGTSCLVLQDSFPSELSSISLARYEDIRQVEQWVLLHDTDIQCVVFESGADEVPEGFERQNSLSCHPRRVDFGEAQKPSLTDYADGVDTLDFLLSK